MISDELSQSDIDALLGGLGGGDDAAGGGLGALTGITDEGAGDAAPGGGDSVELPEFESVKDESPAGENLQNLLSDVNLKVKIRLGRSLMPVEDILKLKPGKVVQLDSLSGDPVDVLVNNKVVAKGEVIILNEAFCVRVTEIFSTQDKLERQG